MRSAIGLMAGPDRPPNVVAIRGRRRRASMAIADRVLMTERPSAPPAIAARASATTSVQLGVSLMMSGSFMTARHCLTSSRNTAGSVPNSTPPFLMLGHDTFISSACTPSMASSAAPQATYSSKVSPKKLTTTLVPSRLQERQLLVAKPFDADVLEADRVDHPRRGLADARQWIAAARLRRNAFGGDAAEIGEREIRRELLAVAERAAGGPDRGGAVEPGERDPQVGLRAHGITTFAASKTGPSVQA